MQSADEAHNTITKSRRFSRVRTPVAQRCQSDWSVCEITPGRPRRRQAARMNDEYRTTSVFSFD